MSSVGKPAGAVASRRRGRPSGCGRGRAAERSRSRWRRSARSSSRSGIVRHRDGKPPAERLVRSRRRRGPGCSNNRACSRRRAEPSVFLTPSFGVQIERMPLCSGCSSSSPSEERQIGSPRATSSSAERRVQLEQRKMGVVGKPEREAVKAFGGRANSGLASCPSGPHIWLPAAVSQGMN